MTDNNGIPFEVKKPFETVYELKNEVPSFEEFMKTYEADESLNYDDLTFSDISEVKGYGPCRGSNKKYWCTCDCNRSDCDCKYDSTYGHERWTKLYLDCPVCRDGDLSYWVHGADNRDAWISNKARIKCDKSDCLNDEIKYVRFACSKHKGEKVNSSGSFTYAVLLAITCKANAGNNNVDEKLMNDLIGHLHRNPWGIN